MNHFDRVQVRELAAWGFDEYPYRPPVSACTPCISKREEYQQEQAMRPMPPGLEAALQPHERRDDLAYEMRGLDWSTGIIDLRVLLSFQRRLAFDPLVDASETPLAADHAALLDFCFAPQKQVDCAVRTVRMGLYEVESADPNVQLRIDDRGTEALSVYAGSPFMEAATYRGRWFLRDGYHRAYALLQRGIHRVPAVIVHARTLAELGATQPRFFAEEILFSDDPPHLVDFLDDSLTLRYNRPPLLQRLRVTVEESFVPATPALTEGETQ